MFAGYLGDHLVLVKGDLVKYRGIETSVDNIRQALVLGKYLVLLLEKDILVYADANGMLKEVCAYRNAERIHCMQALEMRNV